MSKVILYNFRMTEYKEELFIEVAGWRQSVKETLRTPYDTAIAGQKEWYNKISKSTDLQYYFIAHEKEVIGYCGLDKINEINRNAEISLLISPEYSRKGFGKSAVTQLLELAFSQFNLNCVYGECYQTTTNIEFWKKCGFTVEGERRDAKFWRGQYYNSYTFSMINTEFIEGKRNEN